MQTPKFGVFVVTVLVIGITGAPGLPPAASAASMDTGSATQARRVQTGELKPVSSLVAHTRADRVVLKWSSPQRSPQHRVVVRRIRGTTPTKVASRGVLVPVRKRWASRVTDHPTSPARTYSYSVFVVDGARRYSRPASATVRLPSPTGAPTPTHPGVTTTPTPTSSGGADARSAAERGLAWYRDNTGVPAGTVLRQSGPITITQDGTVIDGLEVNGDISFNAANITIRNTLVHGQILNTRGGTGAGGQYDNGYYGQNILIEHVEVDAPANTRAIVSAWSTTMRYLKVHGAMQGTSFAGYNTIEDSYFYNIRSNSGGHAENIISNGNPNPNAGHTVIARNWLDATDDQARGATWTWVSGALNLYSDFGKINTVTIDGNYLTGAGYLLAPGVARGSTGNNLTIRNNVFQPAGPYAWGPVYPSPLDPQSQANWSNNRLADGTVVAPPQ